MSRCVVCNAVLTETEATIRHAVSKQFLDTCMSCIKDIGNLPIQMRPELLSEMDLDMVEELLDGDDSEFYDNESDEEGYDEYWQER